MKGSSRSKSSLRNAALLAAALVVFILAWLFELVKVAATVFGGGLALPVQMWGGLGFLQQLSLIVILVFLIHPPKQGWDRRVRVLGWVALSLVTATVILDRATTFAHAGGIFG